MGTRVLHVVAFIVAIGCTVTGQQADGEIIAIQGWSGAGIEYGSGNGLNVGYDFTVGDTPILVTKLGVYDYGADGLGQSHDVGIWNVAVSSSTPLVSATVLSGTGSPAEGPVINNAGQFRFVELDSALALDANTTYRIGAYYGNTSDVHVRTRWAIPLSLGPLPVKSPTTVAAIAGFLQCSVPPTQRIGHSRTSARTFSLWLCPSRVRSSGCWLVAALPGSCSCSAVGRGTSRTLKRPQRRQQRPQTQARAICLQSSAILARSRTLERVLEIMCHPSTQGRTMRTLSPLGLLTPSYP